MLEPIETIGEDETRALGQRLGALMIQGDVLGVDGPLGAGKTRLIQGLCVGLEVGEEVEVVSPTFAIVNTYPARLPVYHVDLYRLGDYDEVEATGLIDLMPDGVTLVEWFGRVPDLAPEAVRVRIDDLGGERRRLSFEGPEAVLARLAPALSRPGG